MGYECNRKGARCGMLSEIFTPFKYLAGLNEESDRLDIVTSVSTIAGLSAKMNKKLNTHVTILWEHENNIDRDDRYGISGEIRPICKLIKYYSHDKNSMDQSESRKEDQSKLCKACDQYHYELLKSIKEKTNFKNKKPDFFAAEYMNPNIISNETKDIDYLEYRCSVNGYTELLFSIYIEGVFLGAVFVGQILRENDTEMQRIFNNFLSNHPDKLLENIPSKDRSKHLRNRIDLLRKMRKAEINEPYNDEDSLISCLTDYPNNILNETEYKKLVQDSIICVQELVSELKDIIRKKRERKIREVLDELSKKADEMCSETDRNPLSIKMVDNYEKVLCQYFTDEMRQFGVKSIRILGLKKNPMITSENHMKLILSNFSDEKDIDKILEFENLDNYNKYTGIKKIHPWEPICSVEDGKQKFTELFFNLFRSEPEQNTSKNKLHITMNSHMVLLYQTWCVLIEADDIKSRLDIYSSLLKEFKGLITTYLSRYEIRLSKFVTDKYMLTLRLYRHECAQIASAINARNNNDYRKLVDKITKIKENLVNINVAKDNLAKDNFSKTFIDFVSHIRDKNLQAVCDDVDANVKLIIHMADTIGLITERINRNNLDRHEKRSDFALGRDIVTKWEKAYQNELKQKERNTRIKITNCNRRLYFNKNTNILEEKEERDIYHRRRLIDMVIYNLIDNALKYSHWGTNIYISIADENTRESSEFPIIIENYGTYIEPEPEAFKLYYRGNKQGEETPLVDGDGLGLYIVKTISEILDLNITYKCDDIDKPTAMYNIGLMDEYIKRGENRKYAEYLKDERKLKNNLYNKIINIEPPTPVSDNPMPTKVLEADIYKPTYHIEFKFQIQVKSMI